MNNYRRGFLEHAYGDNVHIFSDPFLQSHLGFLCAEDTKQPAINHVVRDLYRYLIKAVLNGSFPHREKEIRTRMIAETPRGIWKGLVIDENTRAVTVNIVRAGALPSQVCFDFLNKTLNPEGVRQDHVVMARVLNEAGQVTGARFGDSKIGGDIEKAIVLFPDPMGATGSSLSEALSYYKTKVGGKAKKMICVNLIITPEYIKRLQEDHPDVEIYAIRVDRGMSADDVLSEVPGVRWEEECGLNEMQYIVPGGGGFGEILNNAYC